MEIPHSSKVVTGRRVPFLHRPDWRGSDGFWIAVSPLLIFGAVGWWLLQFHEGYRFDGVMARATGLGLVAIAFGAGTLYLSFWGDRTVTAPCPVCGESQEWTPGAHSSRCVLCLAHMRVDKDGSIREMPLEDMGGYSVDTVDLEPLIAGTGHVTVAMPQICATCGAEPTTTGKIKDDTVVGERAKGAEAVTANELAALAVPLCAQHADQTPITSDSYVVSLRIDSYRYYRAFLIVNGMPIAR